MTFAGSGGAAYSSATHEWETPPEFWRKVNDQFGFTLDACASPENAKCARYYTREDDGLAQPWEGVVWCNPPYGRKIGRWMEKAYRSAKRGATVVCLVPARTETQWWHDWVMRATEIRLVRGRLRFSGMTVNAPFPSALVIYLPGLPAVRGLSPRVMAA